MSSIDQKEDCDRLTQEQVASDKASQAAEDAIQAGLPYVWRQELDSVTVDIEVPAGTKARDLAVSIKRTSISAGLKGKEPVIAGELFAPIKGDDDSTWSLSDGILSLELQKVGNNWWPHIVLGAPKRDTTRMTPTTSKLSDLDGEMRGVVEKMMFDNRQRDKGLPTSDEIKKKENLERFMKEHPEMDFSRVAQ